MGSVFRDILLSARSRSQGTSPNDPRGILGRELRREDPLELGGLHKHLEPPLSHSCTSAFTVTVLGYREVRG